MTENKMAEDFAAHTRGLPKTDFNVMRDMAHDMVERFDMNADVLDHGGKYMGLQTAALCDQLEKTMEAVKFNTFADPDDESAVGIVMHHMVMTLATVYLVRSRIRQFDMPLAPENSAHNWKASIPLPDEYKALFSNLSELARQKDAEYGASWCKRGGIGAWFTTVRKFDRLTTQLKQKDMNIWDTTDDVNSTEALEETIKDGINYLLLISEKRKVIYSLRS